jgi:hypothetical protein
MKKIILLSVFAVFAFGITNSYGQKFRHNYVNLGLSLQNITNRDRYDGVVAGGSLNIGRSFIVHREPIAGMVRLGIDATWLDVGMGFGDEIIFALGMGVGPAVHINPKGNFNIHAYFRFMPSYTLTEVDNGGGDVIVVHEKYASFFATGCALSWGMFSVGAEARWGNITKYRYTPENKQIMNVAGARIYAGIRF